jgi:O-antigen/teichoic acid export membrane protein
MANLLQTRLIAILRWSERYTKTDMVYLATGGFWLSVGQVAASITGLLLTLVLANLMAPELLGEYRFLVAGFTLVSILALPGMRTALRESTPKGYLGNLTLAYRAMFTWGLLGSVAALIGAGYYYAQDNLALATGFLLIALATPLYNAGTGYLEYLTALKKLQLTTLYTVIGRLSVFAITALVAWFYRDYAWAVFAAFVFGAILPNLWFHHKTVRAYANKDSQSDPGITRYAGHITVMTALGVIAGQLDKIFVWNMVGAEALAVFYIAYTIPLAMSQYLIIVPTLAFAKFGEKDPRLVRQTLLPKTLKYLLVIAVGTALYVFAAPYIFAVLFPKYTEAVIYSQILALTTVFSAFLPIKTYLTSIKDTKALYILSVIPPALRIVVAVLCIAKFGIWGAVWSLITEGVVRTILLLVYFLRSHRS